MFRPGVVVLAGSTYLCDAPSVSPASQRIQESLGVVLRHLSQLETRAADDGLTARDQSRLVEGVRKMVDELERGFATLNEERRRLATVKAEAEAALQRAQAMLNYLPLPCVVIDGEGTILEANVAAATLVNVSVRHLVGKKFPAFLDGDRHLFMHGTGGPRRTTEPLNVRIRPRERAVISCTVTAIPGATADATVVLLAPGKARGPVPQAGYADDSTAGSAA